MGFSTVVMISAKVVPIIGDDPSELLVSGEVPITGVEPPEPSMIGEVPIKEEGLSEASVKGEEPSVVSITSVVPSDASI